MGCFKTHIDYKTGEELSKSEIGKYPLIAFDPTKPEESNDLSKNATIHEYNKKSFQEVSVLDFNKTYDVIEPSKDDDGDSSEEGTTDETTTVTTLLWVHGGGACRALFKPHAELMAKLGYKSILIDLPGHGTLVDKPLSLDSCVDTIKTVLDENKCSPNQTVYIGASFGAYTGFYTLDKLKDRFATAIMIDCGQNVGPDCSTKARCGLWFMGLISKHMSNEGLMSAMKDVTIKSTANWKLVESTFGAGMFFDSSKEQIDCLHLVNPANHIPNLPFPVMYMNGSADHRDSENRWLELSKNKQPLSDLKVYEGGDHFFTHDSRFVDDIIESIDKFIKKNASTIGGCCES